MSVVQRCPSCGTTQATAGECGACHDAHVRFFCTDHKPGLWLDASACPTCGARFGEPARKEPSFTKRKRSGPPSFSERTRARSPSPPRAPVAAPETTSYEARSERRHSPTAYEHELAPRGSRSALWQQLLQAVVRARYMPTGAGRYRLAPRVGRRTGGCLKSVLLSMVLLLLALGSVVFIFGRALLGV